MHEENKKLFKNIVRDYRDLILLSLLGVVVGAVAGAIDGVFGIVLEHITEFRDVHTAVLLPFLPAVGALLIFLYNRFGGETKKGMGLIFDAHENRRDNIPLRMIPFAMGSTWLTHLVGGSVGREGVAVQMSCTAAYNIAKKVKIKGAGRVLLIAGVAAGFSGLFRTPIAAVFFALELFSIGILEIEALLPAVTASFTASFVSGLVGLEKFSADVPLIFDVSALNILKLIILGVACGIAGLLFSFSIHKLKEILKKLISNEYIRIATVGAVVAAALLICGFGRYAGASEGLIAAAVGKGGNVYAWDFIAKLLFTVVCVAAGFKGGEVAPLFAIGATLGALFGGLLGIPAEFAAALGYAAVFASGTNTLIAPVIVGAEIFGWEFLPYMFIVCIIAYVSNAGHSIYPQKSTKDILNLETLN